MIELKEAAQAAEQFARQLFSEGELRYLRLEEAEVSPDGQYWLVTLGWAESAVRQQTPVLGNMRSEILALPRVYKQFAVDSSTGKVVSMKIRDV